MDARRGALLVSAAMVILLLAVPSHSEWLFDAARRFEAGEWPDTAAAPIAVAFVPQSKLISVTPRVAAGNAALGTVTVYDVNIHGELSPLATYSVTGTTRDIAFGLINQDKKKNQDLVVISDGQGVGHVTVMMATDYGAYGAQTDVYQIGDDPKSAAIGRLNAGDSYNDLVIAHEAGDLLTVLTNDGSGGFCGAQLRVTVGDGPRCVALADFDGDSHLDAVVAERGDGTVRVLFNTGDAAVFNPEIMSTTYSIGGEPYSVCVDDFDQDGDPDIAATTGESTNDPEFERVVVLFNDGTGDFSSGSREHVLGYQARGVTTGEFTTDPYPDIAVTGMRLTGEEGYIDSAEPDWSVFVLINKEPSYPRSFDDPVPYLSEAPRGVCAGQLDNDPHTDLLVGMDAGPDGTPPIYRDGVSALLGQGGGTFASPLGLYFPEALHGIAIADVDADDDQDLVVTGHLSSLVIFLGDGSGGFGLDTVLEAGPNPHGVEADILNNDGFVDLVVAAKGGDATGGSVRIRYGSGIGEWEDSVDAYHCGWLPMDVEVADYNDDAYLDIAVGARSKKIPSNPPLSGEKGGVCVLYGGPAGFGEPEATGLWSVGIQVPTIRAGKIDPDDYIDLVAVADEVEEGEPSVLRWFRGSSTGFGGSGTLVTCCDPWGVDLGDLNGDGYADVVVSGGMSDDEVFVYLADPEAAWEDLYSTDECVSYQTGTWPMDSRFADVDDDGNLDIVVNSHGHPTHHVVTIYLGVGDGGFDPEPHDYAIAPESSFLALEQLNPNVDAHLDMVVVHETTPPPELAGSNILVYFGRVGGGRGEAGAPGPVEAAPVSTSVGYAPNPSRESTRLTFSVPEGGARAQVTVYDVAGRRVRRLVEAYLPAGEQSIVWDGKSDDGSRAASGIYLCRVVIGDAASEVKIVLLR